MQEEGIWWVVGALLTINLMLAGWFISHITGCGKKWSALMKEHGELWGWYQNHRNSNGGSR